MRHTLYEELLLAHKAFHKSLENEHRMYCHFKRLEVGIFYYLSDMLPQMEHQGLEGRCFEIEREKGVSFLLRYDLLSA